MSNVLLTGSQGFIGGYIVEELLRRGHTVIGVDNLSKYGRVARSYDDNPAYTFVEGDARDVSLITEQLGSCDHLIAGAGVDLAPQGLSERPGGLRHFLYEEVGKFAAVDVSGRYLGGDHVAAFQGEGSPVVAPASQSLDGPGAGSVEHHDLPLGRLAVHADEGRGLLDQAVRLAGHYESVLGQANVQALAATALRRPALCPCRWAQRAICASWRRRNRSPSR